MKKFFLFCKKLLKFKNLNSTTVKRHYIFNLIMFKNKKLFLIFLLLLALFTVGGVYMLLLFTNKNNPKIKYSGDISEIKAVDEAIAKTELQISALDVTIGSSSAPVKIISYDSFSCIHCANFFNNVFPEIKKRYIDTGKVLFIHRDFPLDVQALTATKLVKCFAKNNPAEKVFNSIRAIYASQKDWSNSENYQEKLMEVFEFAGASKTSLEDCIKDEELENRVLEDRLRASKNLKIMGTPTFFINEERYNKNGSLSSFFEEIDSLLEK